MLAVFSLTCSCICCPLHTGKSTSSSSNRSRIDAERCKRSDVERDDAEAATAGVTITRYGKGEKPKKARNLDHQSKIDLLFAGLNPDCNSNISALTQLVKDAAAAMRAAVTVESPQSKKMRRVKDITQNISLFEAKRVP